MGGNFHRLFIEFSTETQAKIVEQLGVGDDGVAATANLLNRLLLASERRPAEKMVLQAAAQLVSSETVHYFLNNHVIDRDGERKLSLVYLVKYRASEEIETIISQALSGYNKCGSYATPTGASALQAFRRIMDGFRNLSIRAHVF